MVVVDVVVVDVVVVGATVVDAVGSVGVVEAVGIVGTVTGAGQSDSGRYKRIGSRGFAGGVGNKVAGRPANAASMVAFQMRAGNVPPITRSTPAATNSGMSFMGRYRSGCPTHTAVVSSGVKPTIHELVLLSWVPVLPAATRPSNCERRAVPVTSTPSRMLTVRALTSGVSTWTPASVCWNSTPSGPSMRSM